MPKDATKNVDRYKVRGGHLNEYDFEKGKTADKKQTATDRQQLDNEQSAMPKQKVDKTDADKSPKH
jgi:hypothetical protein